MKIVAESDNCGYGASTTSYSGEFVQLWQIACFLTRQQHNKHYDDPYWPDVKACHEWLQKHELPFEFVAYKCEGGGCMPDYARIQVTITEE